MMKRWIPILVALLVSTSAWAQVIGGGGSLVINVTPIVGSCTSLNLFYNNAAKIGCMSGTSWNDSTKVLSLGTGSTLGVGTASPSSILDVVTANDVTALRVSQFGGLRLLTFGSTGLINNTTTVLGSTAWGSQGTVEVYNGYAARIGLYVKGIAGQTADVLKVVNSGGSLLFDVGPAGTTTSVGQMVPGTSTVAGLASLTSVEGGLINVSDQLTACPAKGGTFTGGGTITCLAHFEEGAWVAP